MNLNKVGFPFPAVLDICKGDDFCVIVMEDVGGDALYKHSTEGWYMAAVKEIARGHRESMSFHLSDGLLKNLTTMLPMYDNAKWESIVISAGRDSREDQGRRVHGVQHR